MSPMFPALCRSSDPGCAACPHHARTACPGPGAAGGEQPGGACDRPCSFAPAGSYAWGLPLAKSSAPRHSSLLALSLLLRLLRLPTRTPSPQQQGQGRGAPGGDTRASGSSCRGAEPPLPGCRSREHPPAADSLIWVKSMKWQRAGREACRRSMGMHPAPGGCCGVAPPFPCSHVGWGNMVLGQEGLLLLGS